MAKTPRTKDTSTTERSASDGHPERPETVVILDFGSQYSMLIARRVRECNVYCELVPYNTPREKVERLQPRAFILSGGPASVYEEGAPHAPDYVFESGLPVLGICYGMQLIAQQLGGKVAPGDTREYGPAVIHQSEQSNGAAALFEGLPESMPVWMSHGDQIIELPPGFRSLAYTENSPVAVMGSDGMIGLQFHPEVVHTPQGKELLATQLLAVSAPLPSIQVYLKSTGTVPPLVSLYSISRSPSVRSGVTPLVDSLDWLNSKSMLVVPLGSWALVQNRCKNFPSALCSR